MIRNSENAYRPEEGREKYMIGADPCINDWIVNLLTINHDELGDVL